MVGHTTMSVQILLGWCIMLSTALTQRRVCIVRSVRLYITATSESPETRLRCAASVSKPGPVRYLHGSIAWAISDKLRIDRSVFDTRYGISQFHNSHADTFGGKKTHPSLLMCSLQSRERSVNGLCTIRYTIHCDKGKNTSKDAEDPRTWLLMNSDLHFNFSTFFFLLLITTQRLRSDDIKHPLVTLHLHRSLISNGRSLALNDIHHF